MANWLTARNPYRMDDPRWAEFESGRAAWVLNDREQRREMFSWAAPETAEGSPFEVFLAFVEVNLPVFGFGFIGGCLFTATAAYVWSFYL